MPLEQEKPEENREYKGEWREDKKKNIQNRVVHRVRGVFEKKTKHLKDQTSSFCLPENQMNLFGNC